ncbi:hypothetical protein NMG60_11012445 [Bertholletia excelsa]
MVLKKKLDYGINGYWVPVIPRGPRSTRRRGLRKKNIEDSQICAFELLAAVAGKLLQESEGSTSSNAAEGKQLSGIDGGGSKQEQLKDDKAFTSECLDQGSCVESMSASGLAAQKHKLKSTSKAFTYAVCDTVLDSTSITSCSDFSKKVSHDVKLEVSVNQTEVERLPSKVDRGSPKFGESYDGFVNNGIERPSENEGNHNYNANLTIVNTSNMKDPVQICVNTLPLINSDNSVQLTSYRDSVHDASFPGHRNNVKVGSRDDDENSIGCHKPSSKMRGYRPQSHIGQRRIKKFLTSKYWKVAPKLKDCEFSNTDEMHVSHNRKSLQANGRPHCEGPFKKRKLFNHDSTPVYNQEGSSESICNSPRRGNSKPLSLFSASRISSAVGHLASFPSRDSHVKFSIKSLTVPELYVEVPETATVGSLKRSVMEAVTAVLQGGLHVGVLIQGKKVKDDNRTLLQTGISHNDNLDALGFMLEPSSTVASPLVTPKNSPILFQCDTQKPLTRSPASPILNSVFRNASCDPQPVATDNHVESIELVPSPVKLGTEVTVPDSKACIAIPPKSVEALAMVPMNQKTRRSELVQRRTRRPFSVSEVEALVEAVEKLGTGRWRDVKIRAFENADHRTYVDLKDKWKTLVHTASISPQQRRGEPVPQELLDRVLSAHAYWSQHQSKQQGKHQVEPLKISDTQVGRV